MIEYYHQQAGHWINSEVKTINGKYSFLTIKYNYVDTRNVKLFIAYYT